MDSQLPSLRLAMIANRFQRHDGQGRVNYEVALAALDAGMRVTLLSAFCADELAAHPNATLIPIGNESLPTQLLRNLAFARHSATWLKQHRREFDLIQANGFITWEPCDIVTAHFVHTAWAKNEHYPYRGSLRPYDLYQRTFTSLNARWERHAFRTARQIIAVSEVVAADVRALSVDGKCIEVIYNGVDTDEFCPGREERASFSLPAVVPLALFVGDIKSPRKNLETLLRAMQTTPALHLAVAGDAKGSPAPELAKKIGVADRVHFLGKTKRVAALMRSVDFFVFPSLYEAHPLVVLEAMASALPIVISKNVGSVGSFGELFEVLDDPESVSDLAAVMNKLLDDPERRSHMGARARERSLSLSWSETAGRYLETYRAMCPSRVVANPRSEVHSVA